MDALVARAKAAGVDCEAVVRFGDNPHALIVDEAHDKGVDMIIMGRRGSKGLMKFLMGVVASRVIGYAPCDVLIVPRAAKIEYSNILVATDGSVHAAAAVKKAVDIAKRCGGGILAVSAMRDDSGRDEAEKYANEAADISRKEGVPVETATPIGRPYDMIVETAGGRGVGLIVIGTYGRSGLSRMLMGSTTERVIGLAGCGVLVVK
jgi:nucleotide-binding universal stress UspA family protein